MQILGKSGGSLTSHPTVFSPCSKFIFVPAGSNIKIFEVESGDLIRVLPSAARGEITQVSLVDDSKILAFGVDGCIALWDWTVGQNIRIYRTRLPIHAAVIKVEGDAVHVFVASHRLRGVSSGPTLPDTKRLFNYCSQKMITLIYQVTLNLSCNNFKLTQLFKARGLARIALNPSGSELAFSSRAQIHFWKVDDAERKLRTISHTDVITRLAYHTLEPSIVLGDAVGRIVMWYCLNVEEGAEMPQRTLHWHANEVTDFAFCNEGQHLLSGGEEAVMVLWQIENGLRQYLPRLGDPIHFISTSADDTWAAVSTRDNCIHLVSLTQGATLQVSRVITGVMKSSRAALSGKITRVGPNATLLLPGTPGKVQLFDPIKDAPTGSLELAPQNRRSTFVPLAADKHRPLDVPLTAVSPCSRWMVSLEQRRSKDRKTAVLTARLKFWSLEAVRGQATLLTIIDRPHRDLVSDLSIWVGLSGMPMAASSSLDGTFKLWGIDTKHGIWSCQHVGSYHEIGNGCTSLDVSPDTSVLSVTFGPSVTLWSLLPESFCQLIDVLTPSQASELKEARFVGNDGLLASCAEMGIFSFLKSSLGLFHLSWHAPVIAKAAISVHPQLAQFAMICTNPHDEDMKSTCVLTYAIESPLPIGYHFATAHSAVDYLSAAYISAPESVRTVRTEPSEQFLLAVLDANGELCLLGSENASRVNRKDFTRRIKPARVVSSAERIEAAKSKTKALFEIIFNGAESAAPASETIKHSMAELFAAVSQTPKEEVLLPLVASHVLPPINMLFAHFIKNTVKKAN